MIAAFVLLIGAAVHGPPAEIPAAPTSVVIATARGETTVPVRRDRGHPALATPRLEAVLPVTSAVANGWADVAFAGREFRFLLDAPLLVRDGLIVPLAGGAYVESDTLFVPLQWLADEIPHDFHEGYRWDPLAARFEEAGLTPVVRTPPAPKLPPAPPAAAKLGLHFAHTVAVDAGHGGVDPGNPGIYFPRGITEKDITLAIAKKLRTELRRRGIGVIMTRSTDTLIDLADRPKFCTGSCDLFVSIHVDALNPSRGYHRVNGIHTYFFGRTQTADARRVAAMENSAIRYERGSHLQRDDPLTFIFKDLQNNEVLRESAVLANLIQAKVAAAAPGENRGVAQNNFQVLREALRPSVLVETGYSTNRTDAHFLASPQGQWKLARAMADGIVAYLRRFEAKTTVTEAGQ